MTDVKVKLNKAGVRELLRSAEVEADLVSRARRIASAAGSGHEVQSGKGRNRARAEVVTATFDAMREEAMNRNLTRAIDAGR